jgi:hypothetical protein
MKPERQLIRADFPAATGIVVWAVICSFVWLAFGLVVFWGAA